jgi:hypothetical protein
MASGAKRFEDVIAWQKSRVFAAEIYRVDHQGGSPKISFCKTKFAVPPFR